MCSSRGVEWHVPYFPAKKLSKRDINCAHNEPKMIRKMLPKVQCLAEVNPLGLMLLLCVEVGLAQLTVCSKSLQPLRVSGYDSL